ncbi:MAG: hypothetical protein E7441_07450 [Ruminococcaceae bacterium]|nr:hypothetical protein [Oscillospiraceae bacterium]
MKRILSIILAVSMIISLIPVFSFVSAENIVYTYEFGTDSGVAGNTYIKKVEYSMTNNKWQFYAAATDALAGTAQIKTGRLNITCSETRGMWLALEIDVPEKGWYKIEFSSYRIKNNGGVGDVYVLPINTDLTDIDSAVSGDGAVAVAKDIKYYDTESSSESVKEKAAYSSLSKGKHILLFRTTAANTTSGAKNTYAMYPDSLSLTKLGEEEPGYKLIPAKTMLMPGEKVSVSLVDFEDNPVNDWSVKKIESFDASIATADGKTLTAGRVFGSVLITATVIIDGAEKEAQGTVTVINPGSPLIYSFGTASGVPGDTKLSDVEYSMTDEKWTVHSAEKEALLNNAQVKENRMNVTTSEKNGMWLALEMNIPKSGWYKIQFSSYRIKNNGGVGDVYILPQNADLSDIDAAIASGNAVAVAQGVKYYDTQKSAETVKEEIVVDRLDGVKQIIVFRATAANTADGAKNTYTMYPSALSLEWLGAEEPLYSLKAETEVLMPGQSVNLSVGDYLGRTVEEYTIKEISSENEDIATVSENVVTAVGNTFGRVRISAVLDICGKEKRAECLVRVIDAEDSGERVAYALDTRHVNSRGEEWVNPTYVREPGHYKKADEEKSDIAGLVPETDGITADYTDGWSFYAYDPGVIKQERTFFQSSGNFLRIRIAQKQWCAIKMNIPESGHYRALLKHIAYNIGGYGTVYLIPVPEEKESIEQYMTDAYKLGDFSSYNENVSAWNAEGAAVSTYLGEAYVDNAGDYLLVIQNTGRANELFVNDIILSGTNPLTDVKRAISRNLDVGDTLHLDASLIEWEADVEEYSDNVTLSYENKTPGIIEVSDDGVVTAVGYGTGEVVVTARWNGYEISDKCTVIVGSGKTRRSYYTEEKIKNLKNNITRYEWARDERDAYVEEADKLLEHGVDKLYSMITTQELPRANQIAYRFNDSGPHNCLHCDKYVYTEYGGYPWDIDVFARPWKIQCPDCKRLFPSNDFGKFYELGIDEHGNYRFALALQRHHEKFVCKDGENCECAPPAGERGSEEWNAYYGYGVKGGYLYNDTYGEKDDALFAVDDGWGYEYTYTYKKADGTPELNEDGSVKTEVRCKPFIAYYNMWGLWETEIQSWVENLSMAYLYTDDAKYGRAAAILIDRIADIYPDFDTTECGAKFLVSDGNTIKWSNGKTTGASRGKIMGRLHEYELITPCALAYDAVFPLLSDSELISYLSEKAEKYKLENKKSNASEIAMNFENNVLREAHKCFLDYRISGNFGVPEKCHLITAVVLDTLPETEDWIKWVFQSGGRKSIYEYTGGNVYSQIITAARVDRDGHGNEASPSYNGLWVNCMVEIADVLEKYDKVANVNLYVHPKLIRMLTSQIDILCVSTAAPNIGDHDRMGRHLPGTSVEALLTAYNVITDEEIRENIARAIYLRNGKKTDNLHSSIFDTEPEAVVADIEKIAGTGRIALELGSRALAGYGISILRAGDWYMANNTSKNVNTQRDFYLWYGQTGGHGDYDKLNLGFHAYGLDVGADIGEARLKNTTDPHRFEMQEVTQSHNTVTVNNVSQKATLDGNVEHFDDAGRVKVMDAEAPEVYSAQGVEEYKRTLVMVDANDDVSYGVDFFHIVGGEDHLYSFHTLATDRELSENIAVESQKDDAGNYIGSYQGIDKKWGGSTVKDDSDGLGTYSWFGEVDRATDPANADVFSMDWKIVDNDKVLQPAQKDLRVRLTMLNSFKLDEITTSSGIPPQVYNALPKVRFLFARHTGENDGKAADEKLDTLFTSVVEPYNKDRYISNIEKVNVTRADGAEFTTDEAKAVKVTLTNGRVDYIVYAKDSSVPYKVYYSETESFEFCGYVGVVSMVDGKITYTYVNDGTTIADNTGLLPAHNGEVTGFQRDLSANNWMDIDFEGDVAPETLAGKYIYVDNGLSDNAAYLIESAAPSPDIDGSIRLSLGNTTLITSYVDDYDFDKGYNYNIKVTDKARIPLSYVDDNAPVFEAISDSITTSAESSINVALKANSEHGAVTYSSVTLPRGASLNSDTGVITWKPDASQVGENLVQVDAIDEEGRVTRANFTITVYGSTTSKPSDAAGTDGTETPAGGGGGDGGGGGAAPSDEKDNAGDSSTDVGDGGSDVPQDNADGSDQTNAGNGVHDIPQFTDLGNHAWAADAINTLAADEIIKGTSASTYSPANNITRADFALLLVRAFKLESDNAENFADVSANDYFAPELAIARNTGIVGGVGENKFAPRNSITRQDMMVIVYRALQSLGNEPPLPKGSEAERNVGAAMNDSPVDYQNRDVTEPGEMGAVEDGGGISPSQYPDFTTVAPYAREAVSALIGAGLVNGKSGHIAPLDYTTRAEVAVLVKRMLDYIK